jgi:acyl carrier protein
MVGSLFGKEKAMVRGLKEEELMELVKEIAEEALEADLDNATPQTPLSSLGLDSSDLLELVSLLEDRLDICVPDSRFKDLETVGNLITVLEELQAPELPAGQPAPDGADVG